MKILVTGACGQLGSDVCAALSARNIAHWGIDLSECDLTDAPRVRSLIRDYRPSGVIHCAAYTAVDRAESNEAACREINATATRIIAESCQEIGAAMLYVSTDYVFSGEGDTPFETNALKAPLGVYGQTKLEGELAVQELLQRAFIVRTSWVFGAGGNNFVKSMRRLGRERESLNVVCDQIGSPTYTADLAPLLCDMIATDHYGVYHATNEGFCSWAEFAHAIMKQAGLPCEIRPILTGDYPTAAKRPLNSRMSKTSLDSAGFHRLPPWEDALARYILTL